MNVSTPITENTAAEPPFSAEILTFSGHINVLLFLSDKTTFILCYPIK